ncbi:putative 2og-fe oxygenase protein [Daldinia childiae]|uniref:putative 2og-fe oxygenase protein n=1 Tax=Daldinia childiae TaxID=326645 RepID=UPI001446F4C0|nr:putative 2og-fe oxygenase protein [Daldinia childiae]KAF3062256.1 putative 2og-fe oxygenase protein [Daldinia childiae]
MSRYSELSDDIDFEFTPEKDDTNEINEYLLRCLDETQTAARVAVSKQHEAFVNPGLTIANILIPLPLMPRDAETIRSVSEEASFGKGDETVVDTSVRKIWELDHTQFMFANPAWQAYVATLLEDAAQSLAMSEVRAEPCKLLLYGEGSFFESHKDSENVPGMIGKLVICLPSKHDGGSIHLSHAGKSYVFDTDKTSDFGLTSLSWFSDVTPEIQPLKSGYRLVLIYNVTHTGHKHISAGLVEQQSENLRSALVEWQSKLPFQGKLVYKLEHKYTNSSLKLSNLKGRDRAVCQSLYEVGLSCGFTIFLAEMIRTQGADPRESDEYEWSTTGLTRLEDVRTCDGLAVCNIVFLNSGDILGSNLWDRDADSESGGDFTGNEDMSLTLRYHDTVSSR